MSGWSFSAIGTPASQGSKKHVGRGIMVESSKALKPWRDTVTAAAFGAGPKLDGPLFVKMVFTLPRPKSARKKDWAPFHYPDVSKLARAAEDSISAAGLWADDARVVDYVRLSKVWPGGVDSLPVPGVIVACMEADGVDDYVTTNQVILLFDDELARVWQRFSAGVPA